MKHFITALVCVSTLVVALCLVLPARQAVAQESWGLPTGKTCTIQFRKDAFGSSPGATGSPYLSNDGKFQLSGTLLATFDNWLVLKVNDSRTHWIRYDSTIMVTVDTSPAGK